MVYEGYMVIICLLLTALRRLRMLMEAKHGLESETHV